MRERFYQKLNALEQKRVLEFPLVWSFEYPEAAGPIFRGRDSKFEPFHLGKLEIKMNFYFWKKKTGEKRSKKPEKTLSLILDYCIFKSITPFRP